MGTATGTLPAPSPAPEAARAPASPHVDELSLVRATFKAVTAPRRLLPILVAALPMVAAQAHFTTSREPLAIPLAMVMVAAFVLVAPLTFRVLFPEGLDFGHGAIRVLMYGTLSSGVVLVIGAVIPKVLRMQDSFLTERSSLIVSAGLFVVGGWGLGRDIEMEQRLRREKERSAMLSREAERVHLLAIRSHLDPHFLFNTLNAIAEWCREDGEVAERAVLELSAMLRAMLDGVRAEAWPLAKELEMVRNLFDLHRMRDKDRFTLEEKIPSDLPPVSVPPMSLLTLAENAMKHGPGAGHRGVVTLEVKRDGAGTRLSIENPGRYAGPRTGSQGLPTLERRLRLAYDGHARLAVGPASDEQRTRGELWIPDQGVR